MIRGVLETVNSWVSQRDMFLFFPIASHYARLNHTLPPFLSLDIWENSTVSWSFLGVVVYGGWAGPGL